MDILSENTVKTRKATRCNGCDLVWRKGTVFRKQNIADAGTIYQFAICPICEDLLKTMDITELENGEMAGHPKFFEKMKEYGFSKIGRAYAQEAEV